MNENVNHSGDNNQVLVAVIAPKHQWLFVVTVHLLCFQFHTGDGTFSFLCNIERNAVTGIAVSWVVFFGAAYIYKKETLLRVDFLYLKAKGAVRLCWEMLWHILECAVLVILTIYGCRYAQSQSTGVTYSLGINRAAYSIPMIYCAASMLIGMIEKIYDSVVNYRQGKKEAT